MIKQKNAGQRIPESNEIATEDGSFFVEQEEEFDETVKKLVKAQEGLVISINHQIRNLDEKLKLTKTQIDYRLERLKKTFDKIENTDMEIWSLAVLVRMFWI